MYCKATGCSSTIALHYQGCEKAVNNGEYLDLLIHSIVMYKFLNIRI